MFLLSKDQQAPQARRTVDSGNPRNPVHRQGSERSFGDTDTGADHPEDPEDC